MENAEAVDEAEAEAWAATAWAERISITTSKQFVSTHVLHWPSTLDDTIEIVQRVTVQGHHWTYIVPVHVECCCHA